MFLRPTWVLQLVVHGAVCAGEEEKQVPVSRETKKGEETFYGAREQLGFLSLW